MSDWKDEPQEQSPDEQLREETSPEEKIIAAIDEALAKISMKIDTEGMKVSDVVKLLQLRKELAKSRPRYMSIRWVNECDEQTSSND